MSKEIANPVTFFSPYGYLDVDKNEYLSDRLLVHFDKKGYNMEGSINVIYIDIEKRID
jgi:hypothetical protein